MIERSVIAVALIAIGLLAYQGLLLLAASPGGAASAAGR